MFDFTIKEKKKQYFFVAKFTFWNVCAIIQVLPQMIYLTYLTVTTSRDWFHMVHRVFVYQNISALCISSNRLVTMNLFMKIHFYSDCFRLAISIKEAIWSPPCWEKQAIKKKKKKNVAVSGFQTTCLRLQLFYQGSRILTQRTCHKAAAAFGEEHPFLYHAVMVNGLLAPEGNQCI